MADDQSLLIERRAMFPCLTGPRALWFGEPDPFVDFLAWVRCRWIVYISRRGFISPGRVCTIADWPDIRAFACWLDAWASDIRNEIESRGGRAKTEHDVARFCQCEHRYWIAVNDKLGFRNPKWLLDGAA